MPLSQKSGKLLGESTAADAPLLTTEGLAHVGNSLYATQCSIRFFNCATAFTTIPEVVKANQGKFSGCIALCGLSRRLLRPGSFSSLPPQQEHGAATAPAPSPKTSCGWSTSRLWILAADASWARRCWRAGPMSRDRRWDPMFLCGLPRSGALWERSPNWWCGTRCGILERCCAAATVSGSA